MTADHRSANPNIPGVPWWGAVLLAVTTTAMGFAFDAGSGGKELGMVFAAMYFIGCVFAALAVRQSGIFTAVIQPPLLLFVAVPTAYFLFHEGQLAGFRDTLINCGYPLIERFPLMFFTSATVLLIGMARWYYGMSTRRAAPQSTTKDTTGGSLTSAVTSKVSALLAKEANEDDGEARAPRRRRGADRPSRSAGAANNANRNGRAASRSTPSRSKHARPPETEIIEPVPDRPRRPRTSRQNEPPPVPPADPRRRPRTSSNPRRSVPPPPERRAGYGRPERPRRYDDYEPLEPHGTNGSSSSNGSGTHHPISRVRYRAAEEGDDRPEYRPRPRRHRAYEPEAWEYDR